MTPRIRPSEYAPLILDIKKDIESRLSKLISDYFDSAEIALSSASHSLAAISQQADRFECMRNMKMSKHDIQNRYIENIKLLMRRFPITETEKRQQKPDIENELSLVDHSDIDDMVQVKNMGERVASNCREQLTHLEARLEYLALITDDIFQKRALSPINLCQAFDDALGNEFNTTCKKLLFRLFNDHVALKFSSLYDATNNKLIEAGVLPQIKAPKLNKSRKKRLLYSNQGTNGSATKDTGPDSQTDQTLQTRRHSGTGTASAPGTAGQPEETEQDDIGKGYAMKAAPGQSYQKPSSIEQNTNQPASQQKISGNKRANTQTEQVSRTLDDYFGVPVTRPGPGAGQDEARDVFPSSTANTFGHEEILSALSNLQSLSEFQQSKDMQFDAEAIKSAVINEIAKKSGGIVTKRINELATKTIDFIELIFDAIIEDDAISDTIKALLLRLQIPIIKASLLDPEFFIHDTHPARVLLDTITDVGFGVTDHQDETYIELEQVVSIVLNDYVLQTSTFQRALGRLYEYIERQEAIAREKEEAAQKQVLREHARETVLKALRTITTGKTLPEKTHPLVLKRWPTLMYNHYLTNGKDNDEWISIIEALRAIVTSVQPITTVDDFVYLRSNSDDILSRTRDYLKITNRSGQDIEEVLEGLKSTHESLLNKADFDSQDIESATQKLISLEDYSDANASSDTSDKSTEPATPKLRLPTNIVPGMWFLIYMGEDKAPRRAKLSVIIMEDSKLVFVNHNGDIIVEKAFAEFIQELDNDKSRMIMAHSVFDYALSSVIGRLQNQ